MPVPLEQLVLFLPGSILITVVPGADMALVMRQVFLGGTALAQRTVFGNLSGLVVHAVALAAGLSALLAASAEAYTVVKLAGAAYLVFLGIQTLRSARRGHGDEAPEEAGLAGPIPQLRPARRVPSMRMAYVQGLVSTVLNPKPALLFLTYLPQFVDTARPVLPQIMFLAGSAINSIKGPNGKPNPGILEAGPVEYRILDDGHAKHVKARPPGNPVGPGDHEASPRAEGRGRLGIRGAAVRASASQPEQDQ